ncbi:DEAD/DEAH box helicase family protein [Bacillus licheniformis]|nr:DEAD/DEAH box helicase family protein [Bacillus licheniformis]WIY55346.1 DEAD/DEAH box helicase family protein [Bacillus licheniformis]
MGFRLRSVENTNFSSPQEMYKDNKKKTKKIKGPLDYQSKMIDFYMGEALNKKDVAFELPTGSGKTLVGLLIGEFRRRKNKEKVVYVCPNNQLVHQVVEKANNVYGIKVHGFTGKKDNYDPTSEAAYMTAEAIAVTNYSSIFNTSSFFSDADILIFDDAHSSESYIASNWSLEISRHKNSNLYFSIVNLLKDHLEITQYNRMMNDNPTSEDMVWSDKFPNIKFSENIEVLFPLIDNAIHNDKLQFPWFNIKNHLNACNMFLSWKEILIRPYIPPTMTHQPFANATQRIYMSATLGESGELERITGVKKIYRLPTVSEWDKKSIGRRFFVFPNASFPSRQNNEVLLKIKELVNRMLILVQDGRKAEQLTKIFEDNTAATKVFTNKDIEVSTDEFVKSADGVAILANRYDGIDMHNDKCKMLIIEDLPNATHLQEKFLSRRMAASVLFNERVRTRIIQAIGRCTRSDDDYAAVCIYGNELANALVSPKNIVNYPSELRAELEFGFEQSKNHKNIESLVDLLKLFFKHGEEWEEAENEIYSMRDEYIKEDNKHSETENFRRLKNAVEYEVEFQYAIWKEDYELALEKIDKILSQLDGTSLKGYKGFWHYTAGFIAYQIGKKGSNHQYLKVSNNHFIYASKSTETINWFNKLLNDSTVQEEVTEENLYDVIERIENQIVQYGARNLRKFEEKVEEILEELDSEDGNTFERGHEKLGTLLGYLAENGKGDADPDPWWIINDEYCIVSEDKIYKSETKPIPVNHVRQACTHENWIREKVNTLVENATVDTVMITNSKVIAESAAIHAKNIWYINKSEFLSWAHKAITAIRKLIRIFTEPGDIVWRSEAAKILKEANVTPNDFIDFIHTTKLSDIQKEGASKASK